MLTKFTNFSKSVSYNPKSILITGASSGVGAALALEYAKEGISLFLCGRNKTRLELIADNCRKQQALVYTATFDIRDNNATQEFITFADNNKPLDLVIANAGVSAGSGKFGEDHSQALNILDINIKGVANTVIPASNLMKKRGHGQIAIMSSMAAFRGLPPAPAYSTSKAAVLAYGQALRGILLSHNVGVTVICPAYIKTPMTAVNKFPMPFIIGPDIAAKKIAKNLRHNPHMIVFPKIYYYLLKTVTMLPEYITERIFALLPSKPSSNEGAGK